MTAPLPDNALTEEELRELLIANHDDGCVRDCREDVSTYPKLGKRTLAVVASIKAAARAEVEELRAEVERQRKRADAEAQLRQMGKLTRSEDRLNRLSAENSRLRDALRAALAADTPTTATAEGSDHGGRGWEATATGWRCTECHHEVAGLIDAAKDAAHRCATAERGEG